jgi:hypothetical protein
MKFKKILMMDSRPRETDGIMERDLHDWSSQSKRKSLSKEIAEGYE